MMKKIFAIILMISLFSTGCSINKNVKHQINDYNGILAFEALLEKGYEDNRCYQELSLANYSHGGGPVTIDSVYFNNNKIPNVNLNDDLSYGPYQLDYTETTHYRIYDCSFNTHDIKINLSTKEIYYLYLGGK